MKKGEGVGEQEETELYPFVRSDGTGGARREVAHGGRRAAATASRSGGAPAVWAEASGSGSFVEAQGRWLGGLLAARKGGGESSAARSSLVAAMAGGGGFLDSRLLRVLIWNRFYFVIRKQTKHIHQYIIQI